MKKLIIKYSLLIIFIFALQVIVFPQSYLENDSSSINEEFVNGVYVFGIDDTELFIYFHGTKDHKTSDSLLSEFIAENLTYPDSALINNIEGNVYISFYVDINGNISEIEILKGSNQYLGSEALRVISILPDWEWDEKISIKDRKKTRMIIPIRFRIK